MQQINKCSRCGGEGIYIHLPANRLEPAKFPAEHSVVCKNCKFETQVYRWPGGAFTEWEKKEKK